MPLSEAKTALVAQIFGAAPQAALHRLELVLNRARADDPQLELVHQLAAAEVARRKLIAQVFEPLMPMAEPSTPPKVTLLARRRLSDAWQRVVAADPALTEAAAKGLRVFRRDGTPAPELDEICRIAAELLGESDPKLTEMLRLAPVLRHVQDRLAGWTTNLNGESIAAVRLAFKDALEISETAGPVFWEAVLAMLDDPWKVIRLISAAIDRPSDRYLAASELCGLCERLLDNVDARIADLKRFDPERGEIGGVAEGSSIRIAVQTIAEFEEWLALNRHGPWGQRIVEQKKALALTMEARLREIEPAVAKALPTQPVRGGGKSVRPAPKLTEDHQPLLVNRAEAFLTLMEESRGSAPAGGFASLRTKTIETLVKRLDQYCEDLIDVLHQGEHEEPERLRGYLEVAAKFMSLVKGPQDAQIVRRRAAAA